MKKATILLGILSLMYFLSCSDVSQKGFREAEDSELTLLMRQMFDEGTIWKEQIKKGERPDVADYRRRLLSARSTKPEVAASQEFQLFAEAYLTACEALGNGKAGDVATRYEVMVNGCMNCHRQLCPGPMVRIRQLYLE